jgi:hypothetical protein
MRRLISRADEISRKKGLAYVCRAAISSIINHLKIFSSYHYYRIFKSRKAFMFQHEKYKYFYHPYNTTWKNERAVEIPIIWKIVTEHKGKQILEIGNVLSHYFAVSHDVVDKYERAPGVIVQDAVDFHPSRKYDLVVSISTLEHIGWDENPSERRILHETKKILLVIQNLEAMMTTKGKIVITVPLGYNADLDKLIRKGKIGFDKRFCLKRISSDNRWVEVPWEDVKDARYDSPFPAANGPVIGIIEV